MPTSVMRLVAPNSNVLFVLLVSATLGHAQVAPTATGQAGYTGLLAATLKALVAAGASLNIGDRSGTTPLASARARGYSDMVATLRLAGAR